MSTEDHIVSFSLEVNVEKAHEDLRRVQTILYRTLGLLEKTGLLPEEVEGTIRSLRYALMIINQIRLAMIGLMAGTPYGLILGAIAFGEIVVPIVAEVGSHG